MYLEEKSKLKMRLKKAMEISIICIAADMWQDSVNKDHYSGLNVHFLERDAKNKLVLVSTVLTLRVFDPEERKTGQNIHREIVAILHEYELQADSVVFVTDRGGNMKCALTDYTRYNCVNHMCNNIVQHATSIEYVKETIAKVSRVVKYMKASGLSSCLSKALISHAPTRWHTVTDMFDSVISQHDEIGDTIAKTSPIFSQRFRIAMLFPRG